MTLIEEKRNLLLNQGYSSNYVIDCICTGLFPLTPKQFLQLANGSKITTLHYTDLSGLNNIYKLQNTNKPVCTTTVSNIDNLMNGVATKGGCICTLEGYPIFYFQSDAYTVKQPSGRRWMQFYTIARYTSGADKLKIQKLDSQYIKILQKYCNKFTTNRKYLLSLIAAQIMSSSDQVKQQFISGYFKYVQIPFFNANKKRFIQFFRYTKQKSQSNAINQIVDNFGVQKLNQIILIKYRVTKVGIWHELWEKHKDVLQSIKPIILYSQSDLKSFANSYMKQNKDNISDNQLICQGGAAGHTLHPFEDNQLTMNDIKTIINRCLSGKLNIQNQVSQKLDGQNILFTYKGGKLLAARNKTQMKNFGQNALDKTKLNTL